MGNFEITAHSPTQFFLKGELDLATAPLMTLAIADAVDRGGPIVMDMTDVTFMDSTSVAAIVRSVEALPSGCIVLHGLQGQAGRVIDLVGVSDALPTLHVIPCVHGGDPADDDPATA